MLKTMRAKLNEERSDATFESLVLDSVMNRPVREAMLEDMGDKEPDPDVPEEDMEKLIDSIPETDIDDPDCCEEIAKGEVGGGKNKDGSDPTDAEGNEKKQSLDECIEAYIPVTEFD